MQISSLTGSMPMTPDTRQLNNGLPVAANPAAESSVEPRRAVTPVGEGEAGSSSKNATQQDRQPDHSELKSALKQLNAVVSTFNTDLQFTTDSKEDDVHVVKVIDRNTKEVVRQIPSEEAVRLAKAVDRLRGLLVKDQA